MIANRVIGGNGGKTASIFVTGLSETDTVTVEKDGRVYSGKFVSKENPLLYGLPSEYTELEYIGFSGSQRIHVTTSVGVNGCFYRGASASGKYRVIVGAPSNQNTLLKYSNINDLYVNYNASSYANSETTEVDSGIHTVEMQLIDGKEYIDGNLTMSFSSITPNWKDFYIGCYYQNSSYAEYLTGNMYELRFYSDSSTIINHFIPAKRNSDGVIGLYDIITNMFYVNEGTGTFVAGAEIPQTIDGFLIGSIKSYGTYTITATDGTNTATKDVLVDMAIQFDVEMTI